MTKVDGYNNDISPQVHSIIDDWETRLVNENLTHDIDGGSPNHYWIVKNMMGTLMEEMLVRWNDTKLKFSQATTKMVELYIVITQRNVMGIWKKLVEGVDSLGDRGSGFLSMDRSSSMNVDPTMTATSTILVPILPTIS